MRCTASGSEGWGFESLLACQQKRSKVRFNTVFLGVFATLHMIAYKTTVRICPDFSGTGVIKSVINFFGIITSGVANGFQLGDGFVQKITVAVGVNVCGDGNIGMAHQLFGNIERDAGALQICAEGMA